MNYRLWLATAAVISGITGCKEKQSSKEGVLDEKAFYPAYTFINQELRSIDSMDVALFTYRKTGERSDTSIMDKSAFRKFVDSLFTPEMLTDPSRHRYQRSVFMDQTINRVTISMDAMDPTSIIRRMDMLLDPETEEIKSIYAEQVLRLNDTDVIRKLTWTSGLQLNAAILQTTATDTSMSSIRIVWGQPQ